MITHARASRHALLLHSLSPADHYLLHRGRVCQLCATHPLKKPLHTEGRGRRYTVTCDTVTCDTVTCDTQSNHAHVTRLTCCAGWVVHLHDVDLEGLGHHRPHILGKCWGGRTVRELRRARAAEHLQQPLTEVWNAGGAAAAHNVPQARRCRRRIQLADNISDRLSHAHLPQPNITGMKQQLRHRNTLV